MIDHHLPLSKSGLKDSDQMFANLIACKHYATKWDWMIVANKLTSMLHGMHCMSILGDNEMHIKEWDAVERVANNNIIHPTLHSQNNYFPTSSDCIMCDDTLHADYDVVTDKMGILILTWLNIYQW